jgi:cytochrome c
MAASAFAGDAAPPPAADAAKAPDQKAAAKAPARSDALVAKGKKAFELYCVACHGANGDGQGPAGKVLKPPPRNFATDEFKQGASTEQIFLTVSHGVKNTPMVAYAHIPEEDRWGMAYYVGDFIPKKKKK